MWAEIRHKNVTYPGEHEAIVERATWQRVQEMLSQKAAHPWGRTVRSSPGLLMGELFDQSGEPLYSCWAKKGQRRSRYFVSKRLVSGTAKADQRGWRLPAERTELAVMTGTTDALGSRDTRLNAQSFWLRCCGTQAGGSRQSIRRSI